MELNFFIGDSNDKNIAFAKKVVFEEDEIVILNEDSNMWDILVQIGVFKSKGQARKNWKKGTSIPFGFTELLLGKKKNKACIWKPIKEEL